MKAKLFIPVYGLFVPGFPGKDDAPGNYLYSYDGRIIKGFTKGEIDAFIADNRRTTQTLMTAEARKIDTLEVIIDFDGELDAAAVLRIINAEMEQI